jgi:hypothetical protein
VNQFNETKGKRNNNEINEYKGRKERKIVSVPVDRD